MSRKFRTARSLTIGYLIVALGLSYFHTAALFLVLGAGWQSFVITLLIDSVVVIGKLSGGKDVSAKGNRSAHNMVAGGLALTLAANIGLGISHAPLNPTGWNYGEIISGLIVVGGALLIERHMERHTPKATRAPRTVTPAVKVKDPKRVAAGKAGAEARKIKAARMDAELAEITDGK